MLKVEPRFKMDRPFCGPYRVHRVTSTCAHIKLINHPDGELCLYNVFHGVGIRTSGTLHLGSVMAGCVRDVQ